MEYTLNTTKSLELLLNERYLSEFEIIDGLRQHPQGLNFYDWLFKNMLISDQEYARISNELKSENY